MAKNKKAPICVPAQIGAAETAACSGAAISCPHLITLESPRQVVAAALLAGAENAIEGAALATTLGFKDRRALSKQIERERRSGQPICAAVAGNSRGYYLASNPDELQRYIRALDRRLREIRRTRDACGDTLRRMTGQEVLKGW